MAEPRIVALIPARAGSQRVPGKNTRELAGHPLLAYAIGAAQEAGIFERIVVSSDDESVQKLIQPYDNFKVTFNPNRMISELSFDLRRSEYAKDDSPDIEWVNAILKFGMHHWDAFCILRPTSPFRRGPWIRKAWELLQACPRADSIRAVRPCGEHPAKMWRETSFGQQVAENSTTSVTFRFSPFVSPIMTGIGCEAPWHSMPTQLLPTVYTQTAALEIAWTRVLPGSISGQMVLPYFTERDAPEAVDINTEEDWHRAVVLAEEHPMWLPPVRRV